MLRCTVFTYLLAVASCFLSQVVSFTSVSNYYPCLFFLCYSFYIKFFYSRFPARMWARLTIWLMFVVWALELVLFFFCPLNQATGSRGFRGSSSIPCCCWFEQAHLGRDPILLLRMSGSLLSSTSRCQNRATFWITRWSSQFLCTVSITTNLLNH